MVVGGIEPADEYNRLGIQAHIENRLPDAMRHYQCALRIAPANLVATHNLAILFAQQGNLNEALLTMERAALFDGTDPLIHANRALLCLEADRIDEAVEAAEHSVAICPTAPPATDPKLNGYMAGRLAFAMIASAAGRPSDGLPKYLDLLAIDPKHGAAGPNSCFCQSLMPVGPKELAEQRKAWYEANRSTAPLKPHTNDRNPDRVLRVGYVGGDFKSHSAAMMFSNVILNHDPAKVQTFLYSSLPTAPEQDGLSAKFRQAVVFREIITASDDEAETMIRADQIDILVDLAGHTAGGRLPLFTRKPAPVQVTAWGFAHGTGVREIDAFFADPVAIPEEERQWFVERIVDLPSIITYRPPVEYNLKGESRAPFKNNDYFTFACFGRFEKLSDELLGCIAEIMRRVSDSRILFKDNAFKRPYSIRRIREFLKGVSMDRISLGLNTDHAAHLMSYQQADLFLDTWPHGAGVVSCECLYMGVPLLTRYGTQPSGRSASSVLSALGRKDWIARSREEFIDKAVGLADNPKDLAKARLTLRKELVESPVVKGYAVAVEEAYRGLWREWCEKGR